MDILPEGPYAHTEKAPLIIQRCMCPLMCPLHGENGPIPGDMKTPPQYMDPFLPESIPEQSAARNKQQVQQAPGNYLQPGAASVETYSMGPAPVGEDGIIGAPLPPGYRKPNVMPVEVQSVYQSPASIIPVEIPDALEKLAQAGITIKESGEEIVVESNGSCLSFSFELANCIAQEVLNSRKRIELTLPETLDATIEAAKKRLGPDMAALVDLIKLGLNSAEKLKKNNSSD